MFHKSITNFVLNMYIIFFENSLLFWDTKVVYRNIVVILEGGKLGGRTQNFFGGGRCLPCPLPSDAATGSPQCRSIHAFMHGVKFVVPSQLFMCHVYITYKKTYVNISHRKYGAVA